MGRIISNGIDYSGTNLITPECYSTEERVVGCWTDGKPLYQKTIIATSLEYGINTIPHGISNIDYIQFKSGTYYYGDENSAMPLPFCDDWKPITNSAVLVQNITNTDISLGIGTNYAGSASPKKATLTIQYTKTTDVAGSGTWTPQGVPTHHYSTDEHVIGTWIDGSTIYEKTFYIHDRQFSSSGECDFDVTSLNSDILMADNMASYYTFSISSTEYVRQFEKLVPEEGHVYAYGPANRQIETGYITIQYTKSS